MWGLEYRDGGKSLRRSRGRNHTRSVSGIVGKSTHDESRHDAPWPRLCVMSEACVYINANAPPSVPNFVYSP